MEVRVIPVPCGWSAEQAWEILRRAERLPLPTEENPDGWAQIVTDEDALVFLMASSSD